jgi:hypothetical protein
VSAFLVLTPCLAAVVAQCQALLPLYQRIFSLLGSQGRIDYAELRTHILAAAEVLDP